MLLTQGVTMGMFKYITNRVLRDKAGEEKGKLRVVVRNESDTAEVDYVCPECGFSEHVETPWERPFSVKCSKCGFLMKPPKMKSEIKREIKADSKV